MEILVVVSDLPYPPSWGAAIRNYQFVRHLCATNHVTVLSYGSSSDQERARGLQDLGADVRLVQPADRKLKRMRQLLSILSPRSYLGHLYHSAGMQDAINEMIAARQPAVTLVEGSLLMRHRFDGTTVVLDEHNLEFEALVRTAESESTALRRFYNRIEAAKFRVEEIDAWRYADACLFTSDRELEIMRAMTGSPGGFVVPNGVDLEYFKPSPLPSDANSIVFTGRISYRPNTDAVHYFVDHVLPKIRAQRPGVVFTVVGADVPRSVARLAGRGVVVTGRVPDVRPYLARAAVVVAPIRIGSGTRLKVLEALAARRPLVSTSLGCEGIGVAAGEHLLVADDAAEFADSVLSLMSDRQSAEAMAQKGRLLVERRYDWSQIAAGMEHVLDAAVATKSGSAKFVAISS